MSRTVYTAERLKEIASSENCVLESSVLTRCRDFGLIKKKTYRGVKGGKKKIYRSYKGLRTGLWNVQSTEKKATDICDIIIEKNLDLIVLNETWLKEDGDGKTITELTPPGYTFVNEPRTVRRGGGIALIHKSTLSVKLCSKKTFSTFENLDFVISVGSVTVRFLCVYYPGPTKSHKYTRKEFRKEFSPFLSTVASSTQKLIVLGDFNFHWDNKADSNTKDIVRLFNSLDLTQLVNTPTQKLGHVLDWVITPSSLSPSFVHSLSVDDMQVSDHYLVNFSLRLAKPKALKTVVKCRNIKGIDVDVFRQDLCNSILVQSPPSDISECVGLYNDTLITLLDNHAPEVAKCIPVRPDTSWYTPSVHEAKKARRRAESQYRKSGLEVHKDLYRKARNHCSQVIRLAKTEHIQSELRSASSDSKKTFSIVGKLLGKEVTPPVLPGTSDDSAATSLSQYFSKKIILIRQQLLQESANCVSDSEDEPSQFMGTPFSTFVPISEEQLRKVIARSKPTFSLVDPVPTKIVLENLDILLPVILHIINNSLISGVVPDALKTAVIRPLLKKPNLDPAIHKNYRPISNLSYLSKLLERVVAEQLAEHVSQYQLMDKFQSAYRQGHSTETAILRVLNDFLCAADRGDLSLLVLLDLSAAFDTIDHQLLLQKLHREFGLDDVVHQWFESYLCNRFQYVSVNHAASDPSCLTCGVPQGSVLGPVLFTLYTTQLGRVIEKYRVGRQLFADDSGLYDIFHPDDASASRAVHNLQSCCQAIKSWMTANMLKLNDDKTEALLCGPKNKNVSLTTISVGECDIPFSSTVKDLGVVIDAKLTMVDHVSAVIKGCYFHLRSLGKLRPFLTAEAAKAIAVALVISRIDYCNSCLWGLDDTQLKRLQRLLHTAARIVTRTKKYEHITPVLRKLHWLPVRQRIDHKVLSLCYKCVHGPCSPEYLREIVPPNNPPRQLRSSSSSKLKTPSVDGHSKKRFGSRAFSHCGPKLWNNLPQSLRDADTSTTFKQRLKTHLF